MFGVTNVNESNQTYINYFCVGPSYTGATSQCRLRALGVGSTSVQRWLVRTFALHVNEMGTSYCPLLYIPGLCPIPSGLLLKHSSFSYGTAVALSGRGSLGWGLRPLTLVHLLGYLLKSFLSQTINVLFALCGTVCNSTSFGLDTFVCQCLRLHLF